MVLDLRGYESDGIVSMIIHQFGHALGLGHALMEPKEWAVLKNHMDMEMVKEYHHDVSEGDLEILLTGKGMDRIDWGKMNLYGSANYDSGSVMQYRYNTINWWDCL